MRSRSLSILLLAVAIATVVIAARRATTSSQPSTVLITVVDSTARYPLANADVLDVASGQHRFTDEQGAVTFTSDRWRVVLAVNGQRDVSDLATHLKIDRDAALTTLAGLVRDGILETIAAPAEPAPPPPAEVAPPPVVEEAAPPVVEVAPLQTPYSHH